MQYIKTPFHYQLDSPEIFQLDHFFPVKNIKTWYCSLTKKGLLTVNEGWAWDGASGLFTWNSKNTKRGSCAHDVLAKLMRAGLLPFQDWKNADQELNKILEEDGMWSFRRAYWLKGLGLTGGSYALPRNKRKVLTAP